MPQPKFLKNTLSGVIVPWNEYAAKLPEMEPVVEQPKAKPKAKPKTK